MMAKYFFAFATGLALGWLSVRLTVSDRVTGRIRVRDGDRGRLGMGIGIGLGLGIALHSY